MRFTIFRKLLVVLGGMLLLVLLIGGAGVYTLSEVRSSATDAMRSYAVLQEHVGEMRRSLLEARDSEKDFLLRGDERYIREVEDQIAALKRGCEGLSGAGFREYVPQISPFADEYRAGFLRVAGKMKEKLNLLELHRRQVDSLEDVLQRTADARLLADMVAVRRHERDFLLYNDVAAIDGLRDSVNRLKSEITYHATGHAGPHSSAPGLAEQVDAYWRTLSRIIVLGAGIDRLLGVYGQSAQGIETLMKQIGALGEQRARQSFGELDVAFRHAGRFSYLILAACAAIGLTFAIAVSRKLSEPVKRLTEAAIGVSGGDLARRVTIDAADEIGELGSAFNRMVEDLGRARDESEAHARATKERAQELEVLYDIALMTTSTLDLTDVLHRIRLQVGRILDVSTFFIALYDEKTDELRFVLRYDKGQSVEVSPRKLSEQSGFSGYVMKTGRPLLIPDAQAEWDHLPVKPIVRGGAVASWLGVPLIARERPVGVMAIQSYEPNAFDADDERLFATIAGQAAIAIDNAALYQETRQFAADLERRVEERTEELVKANREMEEFTYIVSHDLKSPLVNIQGFSKRLEGLFRDVVQRLRPVYEDTRDSRLRETIEITEAKAPQSFEFVFKGVGRMTDMIEQLLRLSSLSSKPLPSTRVELSGLVSRVAETMRFQIQERGIDLVIGDLPVVACEEPRIKEVFANLLSNAINYIGEDNPSPRIEVGRAEINGHPIFVRDNGIGMDRKDHDRIFRVFTRLGEGRADGHGMGLAYVKQIIRGTGGRIWVESERGKGTTFYFTIGETAPGTTEKGERHA